MSYSATGATLPCLPGDERAYEGAPCMPKKAPTTSQKVLDILKTGVDFYGQAQANKAAADAARAAAQPRVAYAPAPAFDMQQWGLPLAIFGGAVILALVLKKESA